jgi:hypothetical protein
VRECGPLSTSGSMGFTHFAISLEKHGPPARAAVADA